MTRSCSGIALREMKIHSPHYSPGNPERKGLFMASRLMAAHGHGARAVPGSQRPDSQAYGQIGSNAPACSDALRAGDGSRSAERSGTRFGMVFKFAPTKTSNLNQDVHKSGTWVLRRQSL